MKEDFIRGSLYLLLLALIVVNLILWFHTRAVIGDTTCTKNTQVEVTTNYYSYVTGKWETRKTTTEVCTEQDTLMLRDSSVDELVRKTTR